MYYQINNHFQLNCNLEKNQNKIKNIKIDEIILLIENLLSYENLNKDIFIRSCIKKNGFITVNNIQKLKEIKKFNLSNDEISSIILNFPSKIFETNFENYEVEIRNKNWFEMEKYLFSIDDIIKNKVNKIQNYYLINHPIQSKIIKPMERRKK